MQVSDYDPVVQEEWSYDQPALLITDNTLLTVCQSDIEFYYFDKPVGDDVAVIDLKEAASGNAIEVVRPGLSDMALEELAAMTMADLAGLLRKSN